MRRPRLLRKDRAFEAVIAVQGSRTKIADANSRGSVSIKAKFLRRSMRKIDDPAIVVWAAVIDPDDDGAVIGKVRDCHIGGQRQGRVRPGKRVHVVDFAIGGGPAMKEIAVPRCKANTIVRLIVNGNIPL